MGAVRRDPDAGARHVPGHRDPHAQGHLAVEPPGEARAEAVPDVLDDEDRDREAGGELAEDLGSACGPPREATTPITEADSPGPPRLPGLAQAAADGGSRGRR